MLVGAEESMAELRLSLQPSARRAALSMSCHACEPLDKLLRTSRPLGITVQLGNQTTSIECYSPTCTLSAGSVLSLPEVLLHLVHSGRRAFVCRCAITECGALS
jgi:hypothetical protein